MAASLLGYGFVYKNQDARLFIAYNISGYTYDQLFENADWALYRAKIDSRNLEPFD